MDKNGCAFWLYHLGSGPLAESEYNAHLPRVHVAEVARDEVLDEVYRAVLGCCGLRRNDLYLLEQRGFTWTEVTDLGYGSFEWGRNTDQAVAGIVEQFGEKVISTVPGFTWNPKKKAWVVVRTHGIAIPVRNRLGQIVAIKVRRTVPEAPRYVYWSSRRATEAGPSPGARVHCPLWQGPYGEKVLATEGELKADLVMLRTGRYCLSVPGVSSWAGVIPVLKEMGVHHVELAFDMDRLWKWHVARSTESAQKAIEAAGFTVTLLEWDPGEERKIKGIDDAVLSGATIAPAGTLHIALKKTMEEVLGENRDDPEMELVRKVRESEDEGGAAEDQADRATDTAFPPKPRPDEYANRLKIGNESILWEKNRYYREVPRFVYDALVHCNGKQKRALLEGGCLEDFKTLRSELFKLFPVGLNTSPRDGQLATAAVSAFSRKAISARGCRSIGYAFPGVYVTPQLVIKGGQVRRNEEYPCLIEGDLQKAYGLRKLAQHKVRTAAHTLIYAALEMHEHYVTLPLLATCALAPIRKRLGWQWAPLYLEGRFENGKSLTSRVFLNLFADVPVKKAEGGFISATSTANSIQKELNFLRDTVALVDDVKIELVDFKGLFRLIQAGYDGVGRRRLKSTLESQPEYVIRCDLIVSGEEIPPAVASSVSRLLVVRVRDKLKASVQDVDLLEKYRPWFKGVMTRYIAWTQKKPNEFFSELDCAELTLGNGRAEMFVRQRMAALRAFFAFMKECLADWRQPDQAEYLDALYDDARKVFYEVLKTTKLRTEAESKECLFLQAVAEAIASGKASIDRSLPGAPMIARSALERDDRGNAHVFLDLLPMTSLEVAERLTKAQFSKNTMGAMLEDAGVLVKTRDQPTTRRKINGKQQYCWRIPADAILADDEVAELRTRLIQQERDASRGFV